MSPSSPKKSRIKKLSSLKTMNALGKILFFSGLGLIEKRGKGVQKSEKKDQQRIKNHKTMISKRTKKRNDSIRSASFFYKEPSDFKLGQFKMEDVPLKKENKKVKNLFKNDDEISKNKKERGRNDF